ncbi:MAG: hypothetical protein E6713_09310 [Sporomusaceae bacterium]|nr:hypothetical protein [Sporomusaceae bacterium]
MDNKRLLSYIEADELKNTYSVYGSFYNIKQSDGECIPCRNVLDIIADKREKTLNNNFAIPLLYGKIPEVYFCMMNPGSSEPQPTKVERYNGPPEYDMDEDLPKKILQTPMVSAKPDTTQYMVMNVMKYTNLKHVRVINLSDIREPKSKNFVEKINGFYLIHKNHIHSIFDPLRQKELQIALGNEMKIPVVAAWGKNRKYLDLIHLCKKGIVGTDCHGLFDDKKKLLAKHPLPPDWNKQMVWLADMVELLKSKL